MQYIAFSCDTYYPSGGAYDCKGVFTDLEEAKEAARSRDHGHVAVVEGNQLSMVYQWSCRIDQQDV